MREGIWEKTVRSKRDDRRRDTGNRKWKVSAGERRIKERNEGVLMMGRRKEAKEWEKMWQLCGKRKRKAKSLFLIHKANTWSWGDQGTTLEILGSRIWLLISCKMELNFFPFGFFHSFAFTQGDCKKFTRLTFRRQPLGWQQRNNTWAFVPQTGGEVLWWPLKSGH